MATRVGLWLCAVVLVLSGCAASSEGTWVMGRYFDGKPYGNWWVWNMGTDKFTDEKKPPYASVNSEERRCYGRGSQSLDLLCLSTGGLRFMWNTDCYMARKDSPFPVDLRVGRGEPWRETWFSGGYWVSQLRAGDLLAGRERESSPLLLLTRMEKADIPRLAIRGGGREAEFDITGIREVAPIMAKACGGKPSPRARSGEGDPETGFRR